MENEYFVKLDNRLLTDGEKLHLNEKELYLYANLIKLANRENQLFLTMAVIYSSTTAKYSTRVDNSISTIRETLLSLLEKELIYGTKKETLRNLKANDFFSFYVNDNLDDSNGHTQIKYSVFNKIDKIVNFYIYSATEKWSNNGGFKSSYDRWAKVLSRSRRSAITVINQAVEDKLVFKNIGDYLPDELNRQDVNTYSTKQFNHNEKSKMTFTKEKKENQSIELVINDDNPESIDIVNTIESFNTYKDEYGLPHYPDEHDIILYMQIDHESTKGGITNNEKLLLKSGRKRMKEMMFNQAFQENWEAAKYFVIACEGYEDYSDENEVFLIEE